MEKKAKSHYHYIRYPWWSLDGFASPGLGHSGLISLFSPILNNPAPYAYGLHRAVPTTRL